MRTDTSTRSYRIAYESIATMAVDQDSSERLHYRTAAMEAITGPDAGMVMDRLYQNLMARSSINFGKIPESMGDVSKFTKHRTLTSTMSLLEKQMAEYDIKELKLARDLHNCLLQCKEDFAYGFKVDSQFLKTTYNTMVYSLCELLNLCDVIYIDMLKAGAQGIPFTYQPYTDLLLVQNVSKFVEMVKSGEWARMMQTIKKDARNLLDFVYTGDSGDAIHSLGGIVGTVGIPGIILASLTPKAKSIAATAGTPLNVGAFVQAGKEVGKTILGSTAGKIGLVILAIIAVLMLIRGLIMLFYSGRYKLQNILDDNAKVLKAHIDLNVDASGTSKSLETQKKLYEALSSLRDRIEVQILDADAAGRKELKKSNKEDFSPAAFKRPAETPDTGSIELV